MMILLGSASGRVDQADAMSGGISGGGGTRRANAISIGISGGLVSVGGRTDMVGGE